MSLDVATKARFVKKMGTSTESGCIPFTGFVAPHGYGGFALTHRKTIGAHVASYCIFKGEVPRGQLVRHTCDNRSCVNPEHLVLGTQKQNMQDCIERQRIAKGTKQHLARMDEQRVLELRARHAAGETQRDLATSFDISQPTVSQIVRRVTWRHI